MSQRNSMHTVQDSHTFLLQFYHSYSQFVYKLAWQYCNRPDDIDDFVQDLWAKLCAHGSKLESMTKAEQLAYISAAARNAAISRSRKHTYEVSLEQIGSITYNEADILNCILDKELSTQCFRAVWPTVPQPARELLERKFFLEESDAEIAQSIGISTASVRVYLFRAKKTALDVLRKHKDVLL